MTMQQSNLKRSNLNGLLFGKILLVVEVTSDYVDVGGEVAEHVVGLTGCEVAGAEDVLHFVGDEHFLELGERSEPC